MLLSATSRQSLLRQELARKRFSTTIIFASKYSASAFACGRVRICYALLIKDLPCLSWFLLSPGYFCLPGNVPSSEVTWPTWRTFYRQRANKTSCSDGPLLGFWYSLVEAAGLVACSGQQATEMCPEIEMYFTGIFKASALVPELHAWQFAAWWKMV